MTLRIQLCNSVHGIRSLTLRLKDITFLHKAVHSVNQLFYKLVTTLLKPHTAEVLLIHLHFGVGILYPCILLTREGYACQF